jgi:23S rRNA (pseudouridine1915-N3)-methyltransferase
MYKIKIFIIGKTKESWLNEALEEYTQRLKAQMAIEWVLAKDDDHLFQLLAKESSYICLDPKGKLTTSEEFAKLIYRSRLNFVIGGPVGIPDAIKSRASLLLSLSPLTFTHPLARLVLLEQLYRSMEINRGSPYHK